MAIPLFSSGDKPGRYSFAKLGLNACETSALIMNDLAIVDAMRFCRYSAFHIWKGKIRLTLVQGVFL